MLPKVFQRVHIDLYKKCQVIIDWLVIKHRELVGQLRGRVVTKFNGGVSNKGKGGRNKKTIW